MGVQPISPQMSFAPKDNRVSGLDKFTHWAPEDFFQGRAKFYKGEKQTYYLAIKQQKKILFFTKKDTIFLQKDTIFYIKVEKHTILAGRGGGQGPSFPPSPCISPLFSRML